MEDARLTGEPPSAPPRRRLAPAVAAAALLVTAALAGVSMRSSSRAGGSSSGAPALAAVASDSTPPATVTAVSAGGGGGGGGGSLEARVRLETDAGVPHGWERTGARADASHNLALTFAVRQPTAGVASLEEALMRVSDPDSASYGKHLSREDVEALVAPTPRDLATVMGFARELGALDAAAPGGGAGGDEPMLRVTPSGDFVQLNVSIATAEAALGVEYHVWRHAPTGRLAVRIGAASAAAASTTAAAASGSSGYSLPASVAAAVDFVAPTGRFPPTGREVFGEIVLGAAEQQRADAGAVPASADAARGPAAVDAARAAAAADAAGAAGAAAKASKEFVVTPSLLRKMYRISKNVTTPATAAGKQAVTAFLDEYYSPVDLQTFYSILDPTLVGGELTALVGDGGNEPSDPGSEANLDTQYMTAMGASVPTEFWSFAGRAPTNNGVQVWNEPYLEFLLKLAETSDADVPNVISTSYGEDEGSVAEAWMRRVSTEFAKAGARGITLLFASGDYGVQSMNGDCPNQQFTAVFPAASPYVTSVGATTEMHPETAASFSSGGFSIRFDRPSYQNETIAGYHEQFRSIIPWGMFNPHGRGFPDVSAQGEDFEVVVDGSLHLLSGTSCSTPTYAGVVSLVNELRLQAGLSTLGFLNPLLYKRGASLSNDVASGSNEGCATSGFKAVPGWDPVTGHGTPDFPRMVKALVTDFADTDAAASQSQSAKAQAPLEATGDSEPSV